MFIEHILHTSIEICMLFKTVEICSANNCKISTTIDVTNIKQMLISVTHDLKKHTLI